MTQMLTCCETWIISVLTPALGRSCDSNNKPLAIMGKVTSKKASEYEERLQRTIKAVKRASDPVSVPKASEEFSVNKCILYRRVAGTHTSAADGHQNQQRITVAEEKVIGRWCYKQDDRGFPPQLDMVKDMALHLESKRMAAGSHPVPLGKNWIKRFLTRNPSLAAKLSTQLERQGAYANDPALLQDYFAKLGRLIRQHGLRSSQIFNMDEKGFVMGLSAKAKVICRCGRRNPQVTHNGKPELVTVIETISACGNLLAPLIINKSAGHYLGWYQNLTDKERDYQFTYFPKGCTDNQLALKWLIDLFEPQSAIVAGIGASRLLIFDGHGSHITFEFVEFCLDHNIFLLCLPTHSTHLLQPLDVGHFSPYQHYYGLAVDTYMCSGQNSEGIKKAVFIPFLTEARANTMKKTSIQQAFMATGIWPLNPRRVIGKLQPVVVPKR